MLKKTTLSGLMQCDCCNEIVDLADNGHRSDCNEFHQLYDHAKETPFYLNVNKPLGEQSEKIIFRNKNYFITMNASGKSGWIIGTFKNTLPIGDNWIMYDDGRIVFDNPYMLPKYIKDYIKRYVSKLWEQHTIKVIYLPD